MHSIYHFLYRNHLLFALLFFLFSMSASAADQPVVTITDGKTTVQTCSDYYWEVSGKTYTSSGVYTSGKGQNKQTLDLTIGRAFTVVTTATACESYRWVVDGKTYYTSGTYTYTSGCSEQLLELTIAPMEATATVTRPLTCFGGKGEVNITVTGGTPPYRGAGAQPLVPGTWAYTVVDKYGCVAMTDLLDTPEPSRIDVAASATPDYTGNGSGSVAATASGGAGYYEFAWSTGQTSPAVNGLAAGNYSVMVTDANGCTAMAHAEVAAAQPHQGHVAAKVALNKPCPEFTAFPNPAHDVIQIRFDDDAQQVLVLRMTDVSGRTVRELHIVSGAGENFHEVELSGITPGIYVMSLLKNEENGTVKTIVVQ